MTASPVDMLRALVATLLVPPEHMRALRWIVWVMGHADGSANRDRSSPLRSDLAVVLDLDENEHRKLDEIEKRRSKGLSARDTLIPQGERQFDAYIVKDGWLVEAKTMRNGGRQIQNFRLPGEIVGLDGLTYTSALYAVTALTDASVIPLPLDRFDSLQRETPRLALALIAQTLRSEAILREWEVSLGRRDGLDRLAHLVLELRARLVRKGLVEDNAFEMPVTQTELADCLGMTTAYVNRLLKKLRNEGIADLSNRKLTIRDSARLRRMADFDAHYVAGPADDGSDD